MEKLIESNSVLNSLPSLSQISTFKNAKDLWAVGKLVGHRSLSNFFLSQSAIESATRYGNLWGVAVPGASILLRRDRDFFHLYVNFSDGIKFQSLLSKLPEDVVIVTDIIQRGNSHQPMVNLIEASGFTRYKDLNRMRRIPQSIDKTSHLIDIRLAKHEDA